MGCGLYPLVHLLDVALINGGTQARIPLPCTRAARPAPIAAYLYIRSGGTEGSCRAWIGARGTRKRRPSDVWASSTAAPNSSRTRVGCRTDAGAPSAAMRDRKSVV